MNELNEAVAALNAGQLDRAAELAGSYSIAHPGDTNADQVKAMVKRAQGDPTGAIALLSESVRRQPKAAGVWNLLGSIYFETGALNEAAMAFERAVAEKPDSLNFLLNVVKAYARAEDWECALRAVKPVIAHPEANAEMVCPLLKIIVTGCNTDAGFFVARDAIERWPDHEGARWVAIQAAGQVGEFGAALELLKPFIDQPEPTSKALCLYAKSLIECDEPAEAERFIRKALEQDDQSADYWTCLGVCLRDQAQLTDAIEAFQKAQRLKPDDFLTYIHIGNAHSDMANLPAAIETFQAGLSVADHPGLHNNLGTALLASGRIEEGLAHYDGRFEMGRQAVDAKDFSLPHWTGEDLSDSHLLVWGEQGLGEQILHLQALPHVIGKARKVTVVCDPRLIPVFRRSFPAVTWMDKNFFWSLDEESGVSADWFVALASMHHALGAHIVRQYGRTAYLLSDPATTYDLRRKYRALANGRPVVGVSWSSKNTFWGRQKSIDPRVFGQALASPNSLILNLQYSATEDDQQAVAEGAGAGCDFFSDGQVDPTKDMDLFFAQVAACDHVVTISNTTAHVAGALGKDVTLLVPRGRGALWYWFDADDAKPWYPSMTVIRQELPGDWGPVLGRLKAHVQTWGS